MGPFKTWSLLSGKEPLELGDFVKMTQLECKSGVWTFKNLSPTAILSSWEALQDAEQMFWKPLEVNLKNMGNKYGQKIFTK